MVCKLNRSLYDIKHASRAWNNRFTSYLVTLDFVEAKLDTSLFILQRGDDTFYLLLYINYIVLLTSSAPLLKHMIATI
jgi:hypothetical protein